eukprot:8422575-Alexandrium_andersonii.AAC.1
MSGVRCGRLCPAPPWGLGSVGELCPYAVSGGCGQCGIARGVRSSHCAGPETTSELAPEAMRGVHSVPCFVRA